MFVERLRQDWESWERTRPVRDTLRLTEQGLVLGADTILVPAIAKRRLTMIEGGEARLLALLSAAYARPVSARVLGHIQGAARCWAKGEDTQALVHLALTGLGPLEDPPEAARRLFMADRLLKAGFAPANILLAQGFDTSTIGAFTKADAWVDESRAPAGSPNGGEWTKGLSVLADLTASAARFLTSFVGSEATLGLGLLLIPSKSSDHVEGTVDALPGLSYAWNRDEASLLLTYHGKSSMRVIRASLGTDGQFLDGHEVVARLLPNGSLAVDPAVVSKDLADKDGPNLCPIATKDNQGRQGAKGDKDKDYEDQIKRLVNPDNPTPRGYAYAFFNPNTSNWVKVDDCQHATGAHFEFKSEYEHILYEKWFLKTNPQKWLDQGRNQVQSSGGFPVIWVFAEQETASFARKLFDGSREEEQKRIKTSVIPRERAAQ